MIQVGEAHEGRTLGLCGLYDKNVRNDFTKKNGNVANHVTDFAESWTVGGKFYCCSKLSDKNV